MGAIPCGCNSTFTPSDFTITMTHGMDHISHFIFRKFGAEPKVVKGLLENALPKLYNLNI